MLEQNKITENKVSFYLSPPGELSFVDFGAPNFDNINDPNEIVYVDVLDDFFWSQHNSGVAIGDTSDLNAFAYHFIDPAYSNTLEDSSVYTIIDTGSNAIYFSLLYYEAFIRRIFLYMDDA